MTVLYGLLAATLGLTPIPQVHPDKTHNTDNFMKIHLNLNIIFTALKECRIVGMLTLFAFSCYIFFMYFYYIKTILHYTNSFMLDEYDSACI